MNDSVVKMWGECIRQGLDSAGTPLVIINKNWKKDKISRLESQNREVLEDRAFFRCGYFKPIVEAYGVNPNIIMDEFNRRMRKVVDFAV